MNRRSRNAAWSRKPFRGHKKVHVHSLLQDIRTAITPPVQAKTKRCSRCQALLRSSNPGPLCDPCRRTLIQTSSVEQVAKLIWRQPCAFVMSPNTPRRLWKT